VKEQSLGSGLTAKFLILFLLLEGKSTSPSTAPMFDKVKFHMGGRLVSQRAPFKADSPSAIHPIDTALTPYDRGLFFKVYHFGSTVFCKKESHLLQDVALHHAQTDLCGERPYNPICHIWGLAGSRTGLPSCPCNVPPRAQFKLNALDPIYSISVCKYGGIGRL